MNKETKGIKMENTKMTTAKGPYAIYSNGKGCTGLTLKMIAVCTMLIDHIAATIVEGYLESGILMWGTQDFTNWYNIYYIMRIIGRMAFPIYCFLLVEGAMHTRSIAKYVGNMTIFAIISEVPFDMAFMHSYWDISYNSVFLTLLLGLLMLTAIQWIDDKVIIDETSIVKRLVKCFAVIFIIILTMVVAEALHTDYSAAGIACIAVMYMLRNHRLLGFGMGVALLALMSSEIEWAALFMLIPIYFYNGQRGKNFKGMKYFFYAFYPVHLLILAILCKGLGF